MADSGTRAARLGWPPRLATLLGLACVVWGFVVASRPLTDNSLFTHIATGRLILADGSVPHVDPYSYTAAGEPWTVQSWLVSVAYAGVERLAGSGGIRVLAGVLGGVTGWLVWTLAGAAKSLIGRLVAVAPALVIAGAFWTARPLLVGYLGLSLVLLIAGDRLRAWWLLPVMWVWVNSHGSWPVALGVLAAVAVGDRLDGAPWRPGLERLAWGIAGVALGAVGPFGLGQLAFWTSLAEKRAILAEVVEWQPPNFSEPIGMAFVVQIGITAIAVARRSRWRERLLFACFVLAGVLAVRNVALASIAFVPISAYGLWNVGRLRGRERNAVGAVGSVAVAALLVALAASTFRSPAFDLASYPAVPLRLGRDAAVGSGQLLTTDVNGNLLELLEGTDAQVFLDDRYDMYPTPVLEAYLTMTRGQSGWEEPLRDCGVTVVVWQRSVPFTELLLASGAWQVEYQDESWYVLTRDAASVAAGRENCVPA